MNRSPRLFVLALAFAAAVIISGAGNALAQIPDPKTSTAVLTTAGLNDISMFLLPDGSGTPFTACYERGGRIISAVITVTVNDAAGQPVAGVPATDIRLEHSRSPLVWCADAFYPPPLHAPNLADGPTNMLGQTTFTMSYHGGCWVLSPTYVCLLGTGGWARIPTPVNVSYNSTDLNCDLVVNLADVAAFVTLYFAGGYFYEIDYNYDLRNNLIDVTFLAQTYGKTCP